MKKKYPKKCSKCEAWLNVPFDNILADICPGCTAEIDV